MRREARGVTSGIGPPSKIEGRNGDLTLRKTKKGIILYVKEHNKWHPINTGIDVESLKKDVDRLKRSTGLYGIRDNTSGGNQGLSPQFQSLKINSKNIGPGAKAAFNPKIKFSVNGTNRFVIGVDDGDSDNFKISASGALGTNNRLRMDSSGNTELAASNFKLGTASTGVLLKNNAGLLQVRNLADDADASIQCANIKDASGKVNIGVKTGAGSVTQNLTVLNAAVGLNSGPIISAEGDADNIALKLKAKGNGIVQAIKSSTATTTASQVGLWIDYDQTGIVASGQTITGTGLDLDMNCETVTHVGTVNQIGIDLDMVAAADGTQTNVGIDLNVSGADNNVGLYITVPDGANDSHIKLIPADDADGSDYATIAVADTGDLTIATVGDGSLDSDLTLDIDGDITFNADGGNVKISDDSLDHFLFDCDNTRFRIFDDTNQSDHLSITVAANGATTIATVDDGGLAAHLTLDSGGGIILDTATGKFLALNAGTEFSAANSSYAGMMLGCTHVFGSGTGGQYKAVSTSLTNLVWDTDKYALVTFVVPPSNKVEIRVHLPYLALSGNLFYLNLGTDSSATQLDAKYYNKVWDVDETDIIGIEYSWVVEGSDHSWSAGETKTLYILAYSSGTTRVYTGGTTGGYFGGVKVEAIALPLTIGDGSEP